MDGSVTDRRFEGVAALACKLAESVGGGALCVYLDGASVLDVWAGERDPTSRLPWERDTMAMSWSTTKGVTSTVLHMLADRGSLDYDAPIARYWPEFAVDGKDAVTVRQDSLARSTQPSTPDSDNAQVGHVPCVPVWGTR